MSTSALLQSQGSAQTEMLEGIVLQVLGVFGLSWAILVLYILIKNGHLKSNVAYIPAAGLALANVGQLILLTCHLAPALYAYSIHGGASDPCDGVFIILWYGSLGNVLVMAVNRCCVTWRPTQAKQFFTLRRMILFTVSGFALGAAVAALPYMNVCCHFAFQISSKVIDNKTPDTSLLFQQATNSGVESILSVNFSVLVPKSDDEYLTIIKTNNVLLLTHIIDFFTVFVSIACYALVFYKVRRHGNKISAQQHHNLDPAPDRSPHSSQAAFAHWGFYRRQFGGARPHHEQHDRHGRGDSGGRIGIESMPRSTDQNHRGTFHAAALQQSHGHRRGSNSRTITSTSDVRMLRRISTHFCLMSSAVMVFSLILLVVHRYPTEPALVLLHQLFYVLTATVNSFLISTLNEKIRGDFRKYLNRIRVICCPTQASSMAEIQSSSRCCCPCCKCVCGRRNEADADGRAGGGNGRSTNMDHAIGAARVNTSGSGPGTVMVTFDLSQRVHA